MPKISDARKDERRRQIMAAAMTCFARKGFQQTTILDICAAAGLSAGAVYSYFKSKTAIIEALAEDGRMLAVKRATGADHEAPSVAQLRALLKELERPGAAKTFQLDVRSWNEAIGNRQMRDVFLRVRSRWVEALGDYVGSPAAARGVLPEALAELIVAVIVGCELLRAVQPSADVGPALDALFALLDPKPAAVLE
jgi:TetR/AcrR family transcriptional regulator, transcriptional repressor of aconitase